MNRIRSSLLACVVLLALLLQGPVQAAGLLCQMGHTPVSMMSHAGHDPATMTVADHEAGMASHAGHDASPDADDCARPAPCCQGAALACAALPAWTPLPSLALVAETPTRPLAALIARLDRPPIPSAR